MIEDEPNETEGLPEVILPPVEAKESFADKHIDDGLSDERLADIKQVLEQNQSVLSDLPEKTHLTEHSVHLTSDVPVRSRANPTPHATRQVVKQEIEAMLQLGVIESSESAYASPIVLVKKPDGSNRFCVDYRRLNVITIFDPEPIPNTDDLMARLGKAKFFSKLDLAKGYWQIPIAETDKPKTAFVTSEGLFQFKVLPFRMMCKLLKNMSNVVNYIDDILIFTETWEVHLQVLAEVFRRLDDAGLTARPSKCFVGFPSLEFLGHMVGKGELKPDPGKVQKILRAERPKTKKEVRSFIGLTSYYRKFVPNFAAIVAPITDLTRKGAPNIVKWDTPQQLAFQTLKSRLKSELTSLPRTRQT